MTFQTFMVWIGLAIAICFLLSPALANAWLGYYESFQVTPPADIADADWALCRSLDSRRIHHQFRLVLDGHRASGGVNPNAIATTARLPEFGGFFNTHAHLVFFAAGGPVVVFGWNWLLRGMGMDERVVEALWFVNAVRNNFGPRTTTPNEDVDVEKNLHPPSLPEPKYAISA
ncbi:hypothetical protein FB451DRAFT_1174513 [Mycena latifolia]|nr:hypothetical protein FB451DRAFT_1174513 [Mycena latifolia]